MSSSLGSRHNSWEEQSDQVWSSENKVQDQQTGSDGGSRKGQTPSKHFTQQMGGLRERGEAGEREERRAARCPGHKGVA